MDTLVICTQFQAKYYKVSFLPLPMRSTILTFTFSDSNSPLPLTLFARSVPILVRTSVSKLETYQINYKSNLSIGKISLTSEWRNFCPESCVEDYRNSIESANLGVLPNLVKIPAFHFKVYFY